MTTLQAFLVALVAISLSMFIISGTLVALIWVLATGLLIGFVCLSALLAIKVKTAFMAARKSLKCDMEVNNPY